MTSNEKAIIEQDLYDSIVDGVAHFSGILVGVVTRYATSVVIPENDNLMKRVLRETGSIALSSAAIGITTNSIIAIGAYLKPYILRK